MQRQMGVGFDHARHQCAPATVDQFGVLIDLDLVGRNRLDQIPLNQNVHPVRQSLALPIEDVDVGDQGLGLCLRIGGKSGRVGGSKSEGMWMECESCGFIHGSGLLRLKIVKEEVDDDVA